MGRLPNVRRASVLFAFALGACMAPYSPLVVDLPTRPNIYSVLYMAAVMVCQRHGWAIQSDPIERTIEAGPIGHGSYFITYRIRVEHGPRLRLLVTCPEGFAGCRDDENRPEGTMAAQRALADEIIATAQKMR